MDSRDILDIYEQPGEQEHAFNLIIREYSERLYLSIRRMVRCHEDADDILQNTYIKVWNALPVFRGDSSLYTWIYKIAINETLSFLKKEKLRSMFSMTGHEETIDNTREGESFLDGNELSLKLHKAVMKLPPKQRTVFTMKYFDEMKYEDIADILGGTTGSLKASYHHAYTKITESLRKED